MSHDFGDFAQAHVHGLNGVGGVNDFAYFGRKCKEGDNALPVVTPRFSNGWVGIRPFFGSG